MKKIFLYALLLMVILFTGTFLFANQHRHNFLTCMFHKPEDELSLHALLVKKGITSREISIVIIKHAYQLQVLANNQVLRNYPVVFGSNPKADKLQENDYCTPEGSFNIRSKYQHQKWSRFIWIDYPNNDAYKKFHAAKKQKLIPSNAQIGGEIGIHGVRKGCNFFIPFRINWTKGCISLRNEDVNELYDVISSDTRVTITP